MEAVLGSGMPRPMRLALVALVAAATLAWPLAVNPALVSRRGDFVAEDFGRNLYHPLRPDAVLVVTSDQENALTQYLEVVEGLRPDVARVDAGSIATPWYADTLRRRYPGLEVPPSLEGPGLAALQRVEALVLANFRRRPVYVTGLPTFEPPPGAEWIPAGGLWRLSPTPGETPRREDWDFVYRNPSPFDRPARDHAPQRQTGRHRRPRALHGADPPLPRPGLEEPRGLEPRAREVRSGRGRVPPRVRDRSHSRSPRDAVQLSARRSSSSTATPRPCRTSSARAAARPRAAAEASLYIGQILAARGDHAAARERFAAVRTLVPEMWPQIEASLRQKGFLLP